MNKQKAVATQTHQIITKHTQHRNTLIIYMSTLIHKYILYSHSKKENENMIIINI